MEAGERTEEVVSGTIPTTPPVPDPSGPAAENSTLLTLEEEEAVF